MVALRRLEDAERDGDQIYAVIRGIGTSSDGNSKSIYAPRAEGQAKALRRAYAAAGYSPATVEPVEAHGTGTKAGDAVEVEALTSVFGGGGPGGSPMVRARLCQVANWAYQGGCGRCGPVQDRDGLAS